MILLTSSEQNCIANFDESQSPFNCHCKIENSNELWNVDEGYWVASYPKLPNDFSLLSGCSVSINRHKILLIGGHHVKKVASDLIAPMSTPINDQMREFDFVNGTWTTHESVPIDTNVYSQDVAYRCSLTLNKLGKK